MSSGKSKIIIMSSGKSGRRIGEVRSRADQSGGGGRRPREGFRRVPCPGVAGLGVWGAPNGGRPGLGCADRDSGGSHSVAPGRKVRQGHGRCVARFGEVVGRVYMPSAGGPFKARGAATCSTRGHRMTTSGEHEPRAMDWASYDALREAVAVARRERRQRGERYVARHRLRPADNADGHDTDRQSA